MLYLLQFKFKKLFINLMVINFSHQGSFMVYNRNIFQDKEDSLFYYFRFRDLKNECVLTLLLTKRCVDHCHFQNNAN